MGDTFVTGWLQLSVECGAGSGGRGATHRACAGLRGHGRWYFLAMVNLREGM